MIFRCTQRLLKGTKLPITAETPESAAALGEWYVNIVPVPFAGRSLVLYTNPTTLVCVVAPGRALHTTLPTFRNRLPALLRRLELPGEWIDAQLSDLSETIVARTNNRRVLGSMNDLATQIWFEAERYRSFEGIDLDRLEVKLADNPHGMLGTRMPRGCSRSWPGLLNYVLFRIAPPRCTRPPGSRRSGSTYA
jgi:hypothetical protein